MNIITLAEAKLLKPGTKCTYVIVADDKINTHPAVILHYDKHTNSLWITVLKAEPVTLKLDCEVYDKFWAISDPAENLFEKPNAEPCGTCEHTKEQCVGCNITGIVYSNYQKKK